MSTCLFFHLKFTVFKKRLSSCLIGIFPKTIRMNAHVYPWHFYRRNLGHSPELLLRDNKILMEFSTLVKQKIVVLLMLLVNTIGGLILSIKKNCSSNNKIFAVVYQLSSFKKYWRHDYCDHKYERCYLSIPNCSQSK